MGSWFGVDSRPKGKRPKTALQAQSCHAQRSGTALLLRSPAPAATRVPSVINCLTTLLGPSQGAFPGAFPSLVPGLLLQPAAPLPPQGMSLCPCGECPSVPQRWAQLSFLQPERWLTVQSLQERLCSLTLISGLQEPQGRQPLFLAARRDLGAVFWSFPLDAHKGEKTCSGGSGNEALMPSLRALPGLNFGMP